MHRWVLTEFRNTNNGNEDKKRKSTNIYRDKVYVEEDKVQNKLDAKCIKEFSFLFLSIP